MDSLQRFGWLTNSVIKPPFSNVSWKPVFIQQTSLRPVYQSKACFLALAARSEITERDDVLETFLRERQSSGDLIARVSDMLWQWQGLNYLQPPLSDSSYESTLDDDDDDGEKSAARNRKDIAKALDRERRKKVNLLQYEAIKRELWVLCIGIGSACTLYCSIALSLEAAVSYAVGVVFSCLYLQLLCKHADSLSREQVPQIFREKKSNKIGIRSQDLQAGFERTIRGSGMALSSPRLVIPAAIYGLWAVSHATRVFDLEIAPALLGMFVYKAAALVQVYRDNQDLQFVFPDDEDPFS